MIVKERGLRCLAGITRGGWYGVRKTVAEWQCGWIAYEGRNLEMVAVYDEGWRTVERSGDKRRDVDGTELFQAARERCFADSDGGVI